MTRGQRQLVLDLPHRVARERSDFMVAPSNEAAVEWIDNWPEWPAAGLVLYGPSGSGKTHLATVWQEVSGAVTVPSAGLEAFAMSLQEGGACVILDAADGVDDEQGILHLYNRIKEMDGYLLVLGESSPSRWPLQLADLASRLRALVAVEIAAPDDALLEALLVKLFADRQLIVGPEIIAYLLPRMERNFAAANILVARIDRSALAQSRTITIPFVRSVLEQITLGLGG